MFSQQLDHIHQNDREAHARQIGLQLAKFDELVASANHAYEVIKELGPFYGKEDIKEPTFRITAEPVKLPKGSKKILTEFGNDLLHLAGALKMLPDRHKKALGDHVDFSIPPSWRIDSILDRHGLIKVNEIEGVDGASALMMAEQLAYGLQSFQESTAAKLIPTLKAMFQSQKKHHQKHKIALILTTGWPHTINAKKFINFLEILSKDTLAIDLFDTDALQNGTMKPDWGQYVGVKNERGFSPLELEALGVHPQQVLTSGNYNAICNKGIFALLFDDALKAFWTDHLGKERHERLMATLIPTRFIRTVEDLAHARKIGQVVKVSWAPTNTELTHRSKGVAMPIEDSDHGSEERWDTLKDALSEGVSLIAQDYIEPVRIPAFLRKKGTSLEPVEWYNRVCIKYVTEGNPNNQTPPVSLTATEVTLGPTIIPAGRKCAFTAGKLA